MGRYDWWRGYDPEWDNTTHATVLLTQEAVKIIDAHASKNEGNSNAPPMFMYLAHPAPHDPLLPADEHRDKCKHIPNKYNNILFKIIKSK